jgi:deoxycytidylate deaminase
MTCIKLLLNTGCKRIFYMDAYPHDEALALWVSGGRTYARIHNQPMESSIISGGFSALVGGSASIY